MFKLLFIIPLIALVDPFLLFYWAFPHLNVWSQVGILFVYPLLATLIVRAKKIDEGDLATSVLRKVTRCFIWYPGPISKFISLLILVLMPAYEKKFAGYLTGRLQ